MAAHLKKRALAEYGNGSPTETLAPTPKSSETQPATTKRLKLIWKPQWSLLKDQRPPAITFLERLTSPSLPPSQDVMQILMEFANAFPVAAAQVAPCVAVLIEVFAKEKDPTVRVKICLVLGELSLVPSQTAAKNLVGEFKKMMATEASHKVKAQLLTTLALICKNHQREHAVVGAAFELAKNSVKDTNHHVRRTGLMVLGEACSRGAGTAQKQTAAEAQRIIVNFTQDSDARVRTGAFVALLTMHRRGVALERSLYEPVCAALNDENEGVRVAAAELVWVLCQVFPESPFVCSDSKEELRLVDDGFGKLCSLVGDVSMVVRAKAAGLLGSIHLVSQRFLDQTLDKKLMSNMRRKESLHERNKQMYASGEWASGNKWASDAPKDLIKAETLSVISLGACGAFVHGLEDEFLEVRSAALDSICELASNSARFATLSMDFLVDMLNDEIEGIRLNAIFSLRKISRHIVFRDDQLDTVLSIVDDAAFEVREGLHALLAAGSIATKNGLMTSVLRLLRNLCKYPQDRESIWKCFHHLGANHPTLVLSLVNELLSTHAYFDTPEPNMDDPAYISVLILVFNAAAQTPTIVPHFPDHTVGHYSFIRALIPDIVPHLPALSPSSSHVENAEQEASQNLSSFLRSTLDKISEVANLESGQRRHGLVQMLVRDLERVASVDADLSATAKCVATFHRVQMQLEQAQLSGGVGTIAGAKTDPQSSRSESDRASVVDEAVLITSHLDKKFLGLGTQDRVTIHCLHLRAKSLQMIAAGSQTDNKLQAFRLCEQYVKQLEILQIYLENANGSAEIDSATEQIIRAHSTNQLDPNNPSALVKFLQPLFSASSSLLRLDPWNNLRAAKAVITSPGPSAAENALKFASGMGTSVQVQATLENVRDVHSIRVRVRYPDLQTQFSCPNVTYDFKKKGPLTYRLVTKVVLTHGQWSEPCPVELSIVYCQTDKETINSGGGGSGGGRAIASTATEVIELSKPVNVLLNPKSSILF